VTRRRLRLRPDEWPEPDRIAHTAAFAKEDRFHRGPAAHWAPTTKHAVSASVARWLGFLTLVEPRALAEHPLDRVTEDRLARFLDHLSETVASVGRYICIEHLRRGFRVMFPGKAPEILNPLVAQLKHESRPRQKAWVTTPRLIALGKKMMEEAVRKDGAIRKIPYRDGLMIMLWAPRPVRRRGFVPIRIGKQLRRVGEEWRLIFEGPEMKSGRPFQITVPPKVVPYLERFLREVRPMFRGAEDHDALWLSSRGPLSPDSISILIAKRTEAAFGFRISPHRLRHCAASTIAVFDPSQIEVAAGLLDHASQQTTKDHYILGRAIGASRMYADIIAELTPRRSGRRCSCAAIKLNLKAKSN
jgi:integrase